MTRPNASNHMGAGMRVSDEFVAAHPDADPSATELVMNLLVAAGLVMNELDQYLRGFGLTTGSFNVLQILAGDPEPLTPSQITTRVPVPVSTPTMTGVLDTLQRRGLVERHPHPRDRRSTLVAITPAARKLLGELLPGLFELERAWVQGVPKSVRSRLVDQLASIQTDLRRLAQP